MQPSELDIASGAVALFSDQQIRLAFDALAIFLVRLIELFAVHEGDDVGILFDGAGLSQVAQLGAVVARRFYLAIELGKAKHRHTELAGEAFQAAGNASDLFLARVAGVIGLDELEVVNDDEGQAAGRSLESASGGRDFRHVAARRVVDIKRGATHIGGGLYQAPAVLGGKLAVAQTVAVDASARTQQAVSQLKGGHFQADDDHGFAAVGTINRDMLSDIDGERGFAHAGAGGKDHELGIMETARQLVEIDEAGFQPAVRMLMLQAGIDAGKRFVKYVTNDANLRIAL